MYMAFTHEQVNSIYKLMLDTILIGLETEELEAYEVSEIAEFVLGKVDKLDTDHELHDFYSELSDRWPFLEVLNDQKEAETAKQMESAASEDALTLLKQGKIEDALAIAKSATQ